MSEFSERLRSLMWQRNVTQKQSAERMAQAKVVRNAARLTCKAREAAIIGGNTTNDRTYDQSGRIALTGITFSIRAEQDIYALTAEIATLTKLQPRGKGLRMA